MRIERLEIAGFKSFAEPVALEFGQGATAVVGPNGCGKSNIADAVFTPCWIQIKNLPYISILVSFFKVKIKNSKHTYGSELCFPPNLNGDHSVQKKFFVKF